MSQALSVTLRSGRLDAEVVRADWPLHSLCGFAARDNPRRAFLVVSKVLGRHIGARPATMRASFVALAAKIPPDLAGPVLVVGLAETAICLGQGVHEELRRRTQRDDLLFVHSTRQRIDYPLLCRFEEPHSHAAEHLIYQPADPAGEFADPRSLVMVDDEVSTGTTLANLAAAIVARIPSIEGVVAASLTDWSIASDWLDRIPRAALAVSLLSGQLRWVPSQPIPGPGATAPVPGAMKSLGAMSTHRNFGRLGRADIADELDQLADAIDLPECARVRVVGTGEFTYPAFRIAEVLEAAGHDVVVQSTTRSPAAIDGAIASGVRFDDNYGTGVTNYLYNADPADGRVTIICHETPPGSIDPKLIAAFNARTLHFGLPL